MPYGLPHPHRRWCHQAAPIEHQHCRPPKNKALYHDLPGLNPGKRCWTALPVSQICKGTGGNAWCSHSASMQADALTTSELDAYRQHIREELEKASLQVGRPVMHTFSAADLKAAGASQLCLAHSCDIAHPAPVSSCVSCMSTSRFCCSSTAAEAVTVLAGAVRNVPPFAVIPSSEIDHEVGRWASWAFQPPDNAETACFSMSHGTLDHELQSRHPQIFLPVSP